MLKKKSYMDKNNIVNELSINDLINEGFFSKLKSFFKDKSKIDKLKKDKKFMSHLDKLNMHWDDLAKMIERDYGEKVNFKKFKASDFKL